MHFKYQKNQGVPPIHESLKILEFQLHFYKADVHKLVRTTT